ncbi:hypothetical protein F2Q69_00049669 [Brassica cretica]|uniref:WRKY domain-containing protein n=1 Tax=Brassica cretica TaxID=69181 RepID=A0A8S9Q8C3_BRACR|nr:hypothetical protein F2Q69_00049669 [Brassica cretica]
MWAVKQIVIELNLLGQEGTPLDDGHCWRKYEQKDIHGYKNPRLQQCSSSFSDINNGASSCWGVYALTLFLIRSLKNLEEEQSITHDGTNQLCFEIKRDDLVRRAKGSYCNDAENKRVVWTVMINFNEAICNEHFDCGCTFRLEVESWLNDHEAYIPSQLSRCNCDQDILEAMPRVVHDTSLYQRTSIKTGWKDSHLEKRLQNLDSVGIDMLVWARYRSPSSLVWVFLKHSRVGLSHFPLEKKE